MFNPKRSNNCTMLKEIKLVLKEGGKVIETITKETSTVPADILLSLEEFQIGANETLTKLILGQGDTAENAYNEDEEDLSGEEDQTEDEQVTSKKRKF